MQSGTAVAPQARTTWPRQAPVALLGVHGIMLPFSAGSLPGTISYTQLETTMTKKSDYLISRRQFVGSVIGVLGAVMTALVGVPVIAYLISPAARKQGGFQWTSLGPASALQPGVPTPFSFSQLREVGWKRTKINHTVYVVSDESENSLVAFSDVCTHLSCKVRWIADEGIFFCPCHAGRFDRDGNVISGPPPRPLNRYEAKIENGQIMIWAEV